MLRSNEIVICYLTPEARRALLELIQLGLDEDLALVLLEQTWPDRDIYEIDGDGPAAS